MKKYLIAFFIFAISASVVSAATDCPFGLSEDPAPGKCGLYIDANGDYNCDRAETEKYGNVVTDTDTKTSVEKGSEYLSEDEMKKLSVSEVATFFNIDSEAYRQELSTFLKKEINVSDSLQALHDNDGLCAGVAATIASNLKDALVTKSSNSSNVETQYLASQNTALENLALESNASENNTSQNTTKPKYDFFLIVGLVIILYPISFLTYKAGYIKLLTHRRIWNVILLISFLVSGIFGLMLVLAINYGWFLSVYAFIMMWHVEFGIAMAIITVIHIISHYQYYACMFSRKKEKCESDS